MFHKPAVLAAVAALILASCAREHSGAPSKAQDGPSSSAPTKSLLTTDETGRNSWPTGEPGETKPLKRPYAGYPPLIPHSVEGLIVGREGNECLDCHMEGTEVEDGHVATKVPASHFTNVYTGEKSGESPVGIRLNCVQCHVVQAGERPPYATKK